MNVLVTGANGFIDTALCKRIISEGLDVRASVRSKKNVSFLNDIVDVVETRAIDPDTDWECALKGIDTVVRNAVATIQDTISSVDSQSYKNIEHII